MLNTHTLTAFNRILDTVDAALDEMAAITARHRLAERDRNRWREMCAWVASDDDLPAPVTP